MSPDIAAFQPGHMLADGATRSSGRPVGSHESLRVPRSDMPTPTCLRRRSRPCKSNALSPCKIQKAAASVHSWLAMPYAGWLGEPWHKPSRIELACLPHQYGLGTRAGSAGSEALLRVLRAAAEVDARATLLRRCSWCL